MPKIKRVSEELIREFLREHCQLASCPSSVYRLQLNGGFTFRDAQAILPYLRDLGVEAVYLSPIFKAVPGSSHGYDVTDPTQLNPELGSKADFEAFCSRLKELKMGIIADTVPNHMGIAGHSNALWLDVLENGPSSPYARFFDIEWEPVKTELNHKVLIPVLGDLFGKVLDRQEIQLVFDAAKGGFSIKYYEHVLPTGPKTYPVILENQIETLRAKLGEGNKDLLEYLSVITAFKNLPERTEKDPVKVQERNREKEIAKKRLGELIAHSKAIKEFIETRVQLFNGMKDDPKSFDLLDQFLNQQAYRMAFWRVASEEINYRRFFEINELAAIRMEDDRVFEFYHQLIFDWISEGKVQGLRIDHPDGLYDPPVYFRRLQKKYLALLAEKKWAPKKGWTSKDADVAERTALRDRISNVLEEEEFKAATPLYLVAEKILDRKESLPGNWSIHGTVGYDFLNVLNGVFVNQKSQKDFSDIYEEFIGQKIDFDQLLYDKKKLFALVHMAGEINALGHRLDLISEGDRQYRDFTRNNLTLAIREVTACFPVYRTYISPEDDSVSERDQKYINVAIEKAKARTPALNPAVYEFLREVLLLKLDGQITPKEKAFYKDFVLRFQQITGPIMAKGLEDTAFYIYNRFISLNEVGGDPFHFGYSIDEFHRHNKLKLERWPYSLVCSSTHDTKRGEDVRMRLNVLSEIPEEWKIALPRWTMINDKHKTSIKGVLEPNRNTEYFIYQTLLGAWPDRDKEPEGFPHFADRVWEYILKSIREAKTQTNWLTPNEAYEEAVRKFVYAILDRTQENNFLADFLHLTAKLSYFGKLNALSAVVLKIGSPGVVDTYQGSEFWNYCLVDPDNRRPVDFEARKHVLREIHKGSQIKPLSGDTISKLTAEKSEQLKLHILAQGLQLRKSVSDLFLKGEYLPLKVEGKREHNVVAFMRKKGDKCAIFIAGCFFTELIAGSEQSPVGKDVWKDTKIVLPKEVRCSGKIKDVLTGREIKVVAEGDTKTIQMADIFQDLSVSILTYGK